MTDPGSIFRSISRSFARWSAAFLTGVLAGAFLMVMAQSAMMPSSDMLDPVWYPFPGSDLWMLRQARGIVETCHVDGRDADTDNRDLLYGAMRGMISAWGDPYTRFMDPESLLDEKIRTSGEYGGLGMYLAERDGKIVVVSPIEDTPADRAGIRPGDEIVRVDDEVVMGKGQGHAVNRLRGLPGSEVTVWVRREGQMLSFDLRRDLIRVNTVRHQMFDDIGYIRVSHFNHGTDGNFAEALADVISRNAKGIVIDLRNNPGGLLGVCINVADTLLDGGVVVGTSGRSRRDDLMYARPGTMTDLPVAVLVNEGSASASEIVAGALKDRERAVVVGKRTFGKGSVQSLFHLPGEAGMYVTVARYHTPGGLFIDKVGLEPDIEVEGESGLEPSRDAQLKAAIRAVGGKMK